MGRVQRGVVVAKMILSEPDPKGRKAWPEWLLDFLIGVWFSLRDRDSVGNRNRMAESTLLPSEGSPAGQVDGVMRQGQEPREKKQERLHPKRSSPCLRSAQVYRELRLCACRWHKPVWAIALWGTGCSSLGHRGAIEKRQRHVLTLGARVR